MKFKYRYYRGLLQQLGDRARELRYIVIDRIYLWADRERRDHIMRMMEHDYRVAAEVGNANHNGVTNLYVDPAYDVEHSSMGYRSCGHYHCKCGVLIEGDTVGDLRVNWHMHTRLVAVRG